MIVDIADLLKKEKDMERLVYFKNLFNLFQGIMRWVDQRMYEGEFKFDKMDGEGV